MSASGLTYPNRLVRALFQAISESAGSGTLAGVLDISGLAGRYVGNLPPDNSYPGLDFADISAFNSALEEIYGPLGGRGIALRAGTAFFSHGLKGVGVLKGVHAAEFQSLPIQAQSQIGLIGLASVFSTLSDQTSRIEGDEDKLRFIVNPSPFAWERVSDRPVCHLLTGTIQACLRSVTNGYEFAVYETHCQAAGADECIFQINKQPIGRT